MSNRIKEIEKEIELTKELLRLRTQLNEEPKTAVNVQNVIGGYVPRDFDGGLVTNGTVSIKFGNTDIRSLGDIKVGAVDMTTLSAADTNYKKLKYGEDPKVQSQWTETSEQMWNGVKTPRYQEGSGPCECEYTTE